MKKFMIAVCVALGAVAWPTTADTAVLSASKDNTLYENTPDLASNGAGEHFFAGSTAEGQRRRGLLAFDIAGALPAGATVTAVELQLYMSRPAPSSGPRVTGLYVALADWGEGTSDATGEEGLGAPPTPGDATWEHRFYDTDFWTTSGGDFAASPSAVQTVDAIGYYTWTSTPELVADVQAWLDNPAMNYGWVVVGDETTTFTAKRFDTREVATPEYRPALTVTYTTTPPPCIGDMNCDGIVNFTDINPFVAALGYPGGVGWPLPCPWTNGDANNDGNVTFKDIDPFVAQLGHVCAAE